MSTKGVFPTKIGWIGGATVLAITLAWALLHGVYFDIFIPHDSWVHNFPVVYAQVRSSSCDALATWIVAPDSGVPTLIYALSFSLTQPLRIFYQKILSCSHPAPYEAMMLYKVQIYVMYLVFCLGMLTMGRVLFRHFASAAYLFTTALFAGMCLDAAHSDQVVIMVFWFPWAVTCWFMADRHAETRRGGFWMAAAFLFFCLQLLDQYPHFAALAAVVGFLLYAVARPDQVRELSKQKVAWVGCGILLAVVVVQLGILQGEISFFAPSLRASVKVRPSEFGDTGFVQPIALLGTLFPLTFQAAFETIRSGGTSGFIFNLDLPIFYVGVLPLLLVTASLKAKTNKRTVYAWLTFSVAMLLVASQFSKLYLMLFYVPFFDVFRSYFLFVVYAVFGMLVLGGFGLDAILSLPPGEKRQILRCILAWGGALFGAGALAFLLLVVVRKGIGPDAFRFVGPMACDTLILAASFLTLWWLARRPDLKYGCVVLLLAVTIATQALYTATTYGIVGIRSREMFARYQMTEELMTPWAEAEWADPASLRRVSCPTFGSCYLAQRDAVSLKRDLEGTFLRSLENPIFRDSLSMEQKKALLGVDRPFLWIDPASGQEGSARVTNLTRKADTMAFEAESDGPATVRVRITPHRGWKATLNGFPVTLRTADDGFMEIDSPGGHGCIVLSFDHWPSRIFFWSRWLMVALGSLAALAISFGIGRWKINT
jgi:hypothetical protein